MRRWWLPLVLLACNGDDPSEQIVVSMRFERTAFFDAPFPSADLMDEGGRVHVAAFPNPSQRTLISDALSLIEDSARGFSLAGGVFFHTDGPVATAHLPSIAASVRPDAATFLLGPDGKRVPLEVTFTAAKGAYAPENMIALVPVQGFPLRPASVYAGVVMRALGDADGEPLGQSDAMRALAKGQRPAGLGDAAWQTYRTAMSNLTAAGVDLEDVAGLTAFVTDTPSAGLAAFRDHALGQPLPKPKTPWTAGEVFADYCVFSTTMPVPVYQTGTPPYLNGGGGWPATPAVDHTEDANVFLTLPRRPQPPAGTPIVVYMRPGGGGLDPLVERGRADATGATVEAGEGPARYLARAGYAGIIVDSPMAGRRNRGSDEEFVLFNISNGRSLRDSIRQAALETIVTGNMLATLTVDASSCPGGPGAAVTFDMGHLALMGHSTGAWIAPIAAALEPRYKALVLSGAGGSWIANMIYKKKPLDVAPLISLFLAVDAPLADDPALTIVEWAAEPADPQVYAPLVRPRHVLMMQGIVDHYILPRIANATSVALGLDLGGDVRDENIPDQLAALPLLELAGGKRVTLPARGNGAGGVTTVLLQYPGDGIQDAHEVAFQTDAPKRQYGCFLASFLTGVPEVCAEK